ncbi:MAG: hypothetical protein IPL28_08480 [Chloroflexi bacterium]|nr:hypothetical protein [Chloroflexota bacterium]
MAIGGLEMVSPWPAEPNSPLTFTLAITNTSGAAVPVSITLDLFINPTEIYSTHIPLAQSSGQTAIASLGAGETQVITLTAPLGFGDNQVDNTVCVMVDSVWTIFETAETNNIACRLIEPPPPTLAATPTCTNSALYEGLLQGQYWGANAPLTIYWNGVLFAQTNASPNGTLAFNFAGTDAQSSNTLSVIEDDVTVSVIISRPCPPQPDLTIATPELVSAWPTEPYTPLAFTVAVTNTSPISVSGPIFVDVFVNPTAGPHSLTKAWWLEIGGGGRGPPPTPTQIPLTKQWLYGKGNLTQAQMLPSHYWHGVWFRGHTPLPNLGAWWLCNSLTKPMTPTTLSRMM